MRSVNEMSIMLTKFTPYLTNNLDLEVVYWGA